MLNLIFCVDNNGLFGRKNNLPWNFKEDLKYFKDITTNFNKLADDDNIIVMGYNTWISLKKKLPDRVNVVISNRLKIENTNNIPDHVYNNFDDFIINCKKNKIFYNKNIFIIGGKKLLSYVIIKYNKFIKHIFMNIIEYSFPLILHDVIFKIYTLGNLNFTQLSSNRIYCLNMNDNNYYYIKFTQLINNNFNINNVINFTEDTNNFNNNYQYGYINKHNKHNEHNRYFILEDINNSSLQYCDECDSIIKEPIPPGKKYKMLCYNCLKNKCKCLFC